MGTSPPRWKTAASSICWTSASPPRNIHTGLIRKDIMGGSNTMTYDNNYAGSIGAGLGIHSVTVGGSVIGGTGMKSGYIYSGFIATGDIDKVSVTGDLVGADHNSS